MTSRAKRLVPIIDKPLRTGRSYYLVYAKSNAGQPRIGIFWSG
jgi:hypothetical protein